MTYNLYRNGDELLSRNSGIKTIADYVEGYPPRKGETYTIEPYENECEHPIESIERIKFPGHWHCSLCKEYITLEGVVNSLLGKYKT